MTPEPTTASLERRMDPPSARVLAWCDAHRSTLVVWGAMVVWSVALFTVARDAYRTFQLPRFDLGNMVQAVWSTAHGRPLEVTLGNGEQNERLASHVDPILALLAPLWILAPSPLALIAVQIGACALGALPVLWLARRHLESDIAATLLAVAYLAYPWLAWTSVEAFHPVTLVIPLFLFAVWFLDSGRLWAFALCAVLAASTGELMGLAIAGLGIWFWVAHGQRKAGLVIAASGLAWTTIALRVLIPHFHEGDSVFYDRFASVGGSPGGLFRTAFTDPGAILAAVLTADDVAYVLWLGIPLAGAFLFAPALAAVALPQLVVNALSDSSPTTDPRTHYIAAIVPFLVAGSVLGLARLPRPHRTPAAAFVLVLCVSLSILVGQMLAVVGIKALGYQAEFPEAHVAALREAVAVVPKNAPVSATNRVGGHLSARRYVYSAPFVGRAEWLVLDTWDPRIARRGSTILEWNPARFAEFTEQIRRSASWTKVFEEDGVLVFRKTRRT